MSGKWLAIQVGALGTGSAQKVCYKEPFNLETVSISSSLSIAQIITKSLLLKVAEVYVTILSLIPATLFLDPDL